MRVVAPCMTLRQETHRRSGYIDLSKRRVSPEDIVKCEERYNKSKMVHSVMRHVAEKTVTPIETLYESIAWPLNKRFGHAIDAFKLSITWVFLLLYRLVPICKYIC